MTPCEMADTLLIVAKSAKFTQAQTYELIGRLSSGLLSEASGDKQTVSGPSTRGSTAPSPEPPKAVGNVVIETGKMCICAKCKLPQYKVVADVRENMKVKAFIACFEPALSPTTELWSDSQGNVAIDCPACKGQKTVWIKGVGNQTFEEYPEGDKYSNVSAQ